MGYFKKTITSTKIAQINMISQHNFVTAKYSVLKTDRVMVFWFKNYMQQPIF